MPAGPPLDDVGLLRCGLDADGEAPAACEQEAVAPGTREEPTLEVDREVKGIAHGGDGGGVLLEE